MTRGWGQTVVGGRFSHSDTEDAAVPTVARTPEAPSRRPYPSTAKRPKASGVMSGYGARASGSSRSTRMPQVSAASECPWLVTASGPAVPSMSRAWSTAPGATFHSVWVRAR
ncbi:hypothetical protein GS540_29615 [Rhodococcus hoagii]|nr:hypothetical protein [Prescottella equi]